MEKWKDDIVNLSLYDRISEDPEGNLYGKDDGENHTDWYNESGDLLFSSHTDDSYPENRMIEDWEKEVNKRYAEHERERHGVYYHR